MMRYCTPPNPDTHVGQLFESDRSDTPLATYQLHKWITQVLTHHPNLAGSNV
jgi:hypothetical protein